jgi:F-type H+-transporting ATPase subunit delta
MASPDELIQGYADAVFSVAKAEGVLERVEEELYAFAKAVEQHTQLRETLTDAGLPPEAKKAVIREILDERAHPVSTNVLDFVVEAGRAREIPKIVQSLAELAAEERRHVLAEVRSAVQLTERQRRALGSALSESTGKDVDVQVVVDPSVLGGLVSRIGDEVIDGSVRTRLDEARNALGSR